MTLAAGVRLGPYEVLGQIGAGGMGEVYRARDTRLERDVALKVLPSALTHSAEARERLQREARAVASLHHPNICTIYDIGETATPDASYLVMELLQGETLQQRLTRGPLDGTSLIETAIALADALDVAHRAGLIHRDLKPANIFLTARGPKILDFGLAKTVAAATGASALPTMAALTEHGTMPGTVAYMSPEQVRGETLDARTDVFSFGLVLYEAATGQPSFSGPTAGVITEAILNRTPRPARQLNPALPAGLEAVITKAIEKDPSLRYQSIADVKADLERLARGLTPAVAARIDPAGWRSSSRLAGALLAIVVLAAGLWFGWGEFAPGAAIDSLAVLPFSNASGTADADYLSEGLAESLIDQLSRLHTLKVTSRGAAFRFKGRESDLAAVRRELGVRAVVTGRVVLRGENVSINAELVDASDGRQLWGEHYNQKLSDVLSIQDEIARRIADSLGTQLTSDDERRLAKRHTDNPDAYQLYLKGMYHTEKFSKEEMDAGMSYFRQAIALDPAYALAYHGLAYHAALAEDWLVPAGDVMPMAKEAAQKAIRIDDTLSDAHADLAFYYCTYEWNWPAGEQEMNRARQVDPANVYTKEVQAWCRVPMGQMTQALTSLEDAVRSDPLSEEYVSLLGMFRYLDRQYDTAAAPMRKSIELEPNYWPGYSYLGHLYARTKRYADAEAAFRKAIAIDGTVGEPVSGLGITYALEGRTAEARQIADRLQHWPTYVSSYNIAMVYAAMGDRDRAFEWLEKAVESRSWLLTWVNVDPDLDSLRSDRRFADLVRRVGVVTSSR